ncbi:MAG: FAD-dependent oxidoreductase [Gemmatimonadaceae bacterium]
MTTRRDLLKGAAALLPAAMRARPSLTRARLSAQKVIVVGAGAFGGWTALELARRGASVTLIDAWGAGNVRASSGGETRVIRAVYNGERVYTDMVRRALDLWREHAARWSRGVYRETGVLWMFESDDDSYARRSVEPMRRVRLTLDELTLRDAVTRFPQIAFDGVRRVWWEREAGFLLAREACELVREACIREGVEYVTAHARGGPITGGRVSHVVLSDGTRRDAESFVFACGPWLGGVFPDVVGSRIRATKQDVLYFGTPPGDRQFDVGAMPAWVNFGSKLLYGIPGNERRGFKVADDTLGAHVDPTSLERVVSPASVVTARELLRRRFPTLAGAPLLHAEVCQYERTPDGHYLVDWHPGAGNVLLLGGGSGHGFKMGPAIGELAARAVLRESEIQPLFAYERVRAQGGA